MKNETEQTPVDKLEPVAEGKVWRWGVMGSGGICQDFSHALRDCVPDAVLQAVGARQMESATKVQRELGFKTAYGSFEEVAADPDVDIVYVGSIHNKHHEHALMAIKHGKPVLVEKAFTQNAKLAQTVFDAAKGPSPALHCSRTGQYEVCRMHRSRSSSRPLTCRLSLVCPSCACAALSQGSVCDGGVLSDTAARCTQRRPLLCPTRCPLTRVWWMCSTCYCACAGTRFMPWCRKLREVLESGQLGTIHHVTCDFAIQFPPEAKRLFDPALCGGALLDVGIYPTSIASMIFGGRAPEQIVAVGDLMDTGVDGHIATTLRYGKNQTAQLFCGALVDGPSVLSIVGSKGRVTVHDPDTGYWHCSPGLKVSLKGKDGQYHEEEFRFPKPKYQGQATHTTHHHR